MKATYSLAHHERLRTRGSIRRLFDSGKSGFVYPLRYIWFVEQLPESNSEDDAHSQEQERACEVMFTVPKRFHKRANKRNLLRRRVKESYRLQKSLILTNPEGGNPAQSIDLAIIYSTKEVHTYKTIDNAVRKILENIAKEL